MIPWGRFLIMLALAVVLLVLHAYAPPVWSWVLFPVYVVVVLWTFNPFLSAVVEALNDWADRIEGRQEEERMRELGETIREEERVRRERL